VLLAGGCRWADLQLFQYLPGPPVASGRFHSYFHITQQESLTVSRAFSTSDNPDSVNALVLNGLTGLDVEQGSESPSLQDSQPRLFEVLPPIDSEDLAGSSMLALQGCCCKFSDRLAVQRKPVEAVVFVRG
jgi:hypothetical protein